MYKKLALAIAFSPRMEALIAEARKLIQIFEGELVLITEEQFGQRDLGPKYLPNIDSFSGRRYANNVA